MKNRLAIPEDELLTRKRFVIETIVDQLKDFPEIDHTRHRSTRSSIVNLVAGLIACTWQAKKPSLRQRYGLLAGQNLTPISGSLRESERLARRTVKQGRAAQAKQQINTNYVISCDDLWDRVRGEPSTSAR